MQERPSSLPSADRMGMLIASVLLTFALSRLIETPGLTLSLSLPGFYYAFPITLGSFMTLFAAALTAAGMDWLLREHPSAGDHTHREHLLLPALTAFVLGTPLTLLSGSQAWWPGIALGAVLLTAVCVAEYISIDPSTPMYGPARAGLTAVAYALFLVLATSLRFSGARMVLVIPAVFFCSKFDQSAHPAPRWNRPLGLSLGVRHRVDLRPDWCGLALLASISCSIWLGTHRSALRADHAFHQPLRKHPFAPRPAGSFAGIAGSLGIRHLPVTCTPSRSQLNSFKR